MLALSASAYEEHKLNLKKDEVSVSDKDMAMIYEIDSGVPLAAFESLRGLLFKLGNVNSSGTSELGMHAYQAPYVMDIHSIPVKPVPEATSTAFHDVPPKLESAADAQQTYRVVRDAIVSQAYAYHCFSDWRTNAAVMVTGEELEIHVAVMRVVPSNCIRVDFHLLQGDEMQFLYAVTTIQKQCRAIDMRNLGGPDSRRNVTLPQWSLRSDEFATSSSLAEGELGELIDDILSDELHHVLRESAARQFKDACINPINRNFLQCEMPQELLQALSHMLSDTNEAIVCFGVFILLQYASQSSHWHGLINEVLITQCQQLSTSAQRQSTQWLLRQLQDAMGGDAW